MNAYKEARRQIEDKYNCSHEEQTVVKYQQSTGSWRIRRQCNNCGMYTTPDLKMAGYNLSSLPVANLEKMASYQLRKREELTQLLDELREIESEVWAPKRNIDDYSIDSLDADCDFWDAYTSYLRSEAWHKIRTAVLERDRYLCQACLKRQATQVHHLSYRIFKQVGRSAGFELVSICYKCHSIIHPHMADVQHEKLSDPSSVFLERSLQYLAQREGVR